MQKLPGHARLSLLLGAGFSKWAADLPLVSNLFDPRRFNIADLKALKRLANDF